MMLGKLDLHMEKTKARGYLSPCTKTNSNWIRDLNARPETLKLLEENT
jgi:hypothetical protein